VRPELVAPEDLVKQELDETDEAWFGMEANISIVGQYTPHLVED
jgi:hypothetical protein